MRTVNFKRYTVDYLQEPITWPLLSLNTANLRPWKGKEEIPGMWSWGLCVCMSVCVCVGGGGGRGVLYMTPLEQKFRGGYGGLIGRTIRGGGGYGYFLESHNIKWF